MEYSTHSLAVIKDSLKNKEDKFLVYYDSKSDCLLFPNYNSIIEDISMDASYVADSLCNDIAITNANVIYMFERVHKKFSPTANTVKLYRHRFYQVEIVPRLTILRDNFTVNGVDYFWMTLNELLADYNTAKLNTDVIEFVREGFCRRC